MNGGATIIAMRKDGLFNSDTHADNVARSISPYPGYLERRLHPQNPTIYLTRRAITQVLVPPQMKSGWLFGAKLRVAIDGTIRGLMLKNKITIQLRLN